MHDDVGAGLILNVALEAFGEHGYHGTSVREIARRAGLSVAALYHYFPSKYELLLALLHHGLDDLLRDTDEALAAAEPDPAARLAAVVRAHVLAHAERRTLSLVGNSELRSLGPTDLAPVVAKRDIQMGTFRQLAVEGVESGAFVTTYPVEASRAIVTMCTAVSIWYRDGGPQGPSEVADCYVALALDMLGHRRG